MAMLSFNLCQRAAYANRRQVLDADLVKLSLREQRDLAEDAVVASRAYAQAMTNIGDFDPTNKSTWFFVNPEPQVKLQEIAGR